MNINKKIQEAFRQYQVGNLQQTKDICAEILREQPDNAEILYLLGIVHIGLEEYDPAVHCLERSLQYNSSADTYLALGAAFQKKGLHDGAIDAYRKALDIDPGFAEAYENLGDLFRDRGQLDKAVFHYKKALQYFPGSAEIHLSLGDIFKGKKQLDLAVFYYRKALRHKPDYAEAYRNLGFIFHEQGRLEEAISYYEKALECNPELCSACIDLEDALYAKRQREEAVKSHLERLKSSIGLGFLRIEMMINAVINEFYFRKLNVQFHPDALRGENDSAGLRRKILKKILEDTMKPDTIERFLDQVDRLNAIREYYENRHTRENAQIAAFERMHREFISTANRVEAQLVRILTLSGSR